MTSIVIINFWLLWIKTSSWPLRVSCPESNLCVPAVILQPLLLLASLSPPPRKRVCRSSFPPVVTIWFSAFLHCSRHLPAYYKPIFTCWIPPPPTPPYYPQYSVRCRVFSSSRGKWIEFYIGHGQRFVTNSVRCTFLLLHCPHHPPRGTVNCITRMVHCNCTHNSVIILIKTRFILLINETISIEKGSSCMRLYDNHTQSDIFGVSINPWPASQIAGFYHFCLPGTRMFLLVVRAMTQGSCCCIRWWW